MRASLPCRRNAVAEVNDPDIFHGVHVQKGHHRSDLFNTAVSVHNGALLVLFVKHVLPLLPQAGKV